MWSAGQIPANSSSVGHTANTSPALPWDISGTSGIGLFPLRCFPWVNIASVHWLLNVFYICEVTHPTLLLYLTTFAVNMFLLAIPSSTFLPVTPPSSSTLHAMTQGGISGLSVFAYQPSRWPQVSFLGCFAGFAWTSSCRTKAPHSRTNSR